MLESLPQLVWVAAANGNIEYANERFYAYTGKKRGEAGLLLHAIVHPKDHAHTADRWAAGQRAGETFEAEHRLLGANGEPRWFLSLGVPIKADDGTILRWFGTSTDIHRQKIAEEEAQLRREELSQFVENATIGLHWVGPDGTVLWANKCELELVGFTREEYVGRHIAEFHADQPVIDDMLARLTRGETLIDYPARLRRKDGSIRHVLINSCVRFVNGEFKNTQCFTRDITALKTAEEERNQLLERERAARLEAERASRMKDEFLATLSHELRTPLNAILGYAQLMRTGSMRQEEVAEAIEVIERNARSQTQIIEDLLDMSRIISGKIRLDVQRVDVSAVIAAAVESVKPSADMKGLRLISVLDPLAGPVKGDPARIQQIVWNLLTNAVKFTPKGGKIQVALERVNSHIEIVVSDNGEGIKPEFLPHVFDRFKQADSSSTRRYSGLGIGLSIVKQLVELHGGVVRAKSPGIGQGATFIISLPLSVATEDEPDPRRLHPKVPSGEQAPCENIDLSGVRVLVVDDEPDARQLISKILQTCHAEVVTANSVDEALEVLQKNQPHVIVTDIGMPEHDGYELIKKIRSLNSDTARNIPVAALTAFARSEDRRRAMLAGFQTHVAKPVEPAELIAVVANLAGKIDPRGA